MHFRLTVARRRRLPLQVQPIKVARLPEHEIRGDGEWRCRRLGLFFAASEQRPFRLSQKN
jgi:hypothetical protein